MKLRKWVKVTLSIIMAISFILILTDCDDTTLFVIGHIIAIATFITSGSLLSKYGK